jgi:hypothetical protein
MKDKKQRVEETVDCDYNRLCGNIDEAIRYLTEIRDRYVGTDISFSADTTGYDDIELSFVFTRDETDEELSRRLAIEAQERRWAEEERKRKCQRTKDEAQFKRLAQKLGRRYY